MAIGHAGFSRGNFTAGFGGRRRRGAAFSPLNYPGLNLWYEGDPANLTASGGGQPVDGNVVTAVNDLGTLDNDGTATGTDGPTYQADEANGRGCLRYDTSNDKTTTAVTVGTSYTVFVVCRRTGATSVAAYCSTFRMGLYAEYGGGTRLFVNGSDSAIVAESLPVGEVAVLWGELDAGTARCGYEYPLGVKESAAATGLTPSGAAALILGDSSGQDQFAAALYQPALSAADRDAVRAGFAARFGCADMTAEVHVDNTLAATTRTYNPETGSATTGAKLACKTWLAAKALYKADATIWWHAGTYDEVNDAGAVYNVPRPCTWDMYGGYTGDPVVLTYNAADPPDDGDPAHKGSIVSAANGITFTVQGRNRLKVVGTYLLGDNTPENWDTDISVNVGNTGTNTIRETWVQNSGHAALKGKFALVEYCHLDTGGFSFRDHGIYNYVGGDVIRFNNIHGFAGAGVHSYDGVPDVTLYGNVVWNCLAWGILVSGTNCVVVHNTVVGCGGSTETSEDAGVQLRGAVGGTVCKNNYIDCPAAEYDGVQVQGATPGTITVGHNRRIEVGGTGSASYDDGGTDVTTSDLFDNTPDDMLDLRRTGGLTDGEDLPTYSDTLLDPAQANPTGKAVTGTPPIGAFAN